MYVNITSLNSQNFWVKQTNYHVILILLTDEEIFAQRDEIICLKSHSSQWQRWNLNISSEIPEPDSSLLCHFHFSPITDFCESDEVLHIIYFSFLFFSYHRWAKVIPKCVWRCLEHTHSYILHFFFSTFFVAGVNNIIQVSIQMLHPHRDPMGLKSSLSHYIICSLLNI